MSLFISQNEDYQIEDRLIDKLNDAFTIIFDEEKQTAEDFSKYSGTISYEILTSISHRIRRTYLSD